MKRTMIYVVLAFVIGLAMTVVPTGLFLAIADQYRVPDVNFAWSIPLVEFPEGDHIDYVSSRELEFISINFFIALVFYILFKRKMPRSDFVWPDFRR